ncbi:hypothetical protein RI367_002760 [Sorochytrium milnesiophthora]
MSSVENGDYKVLNKLGEGTFSQVLRMKNRKTGVTMAMKRFKKRFKSLEEVECLREIQALKRLNPHPNIVQLEDVLLSFNFDSDPGTGTLYLGFELMDCNLYDLISKQSTVITEASVKLWFYQTCKGLEYLHSKGIFHRDIKPENILIRDGLVKLADLGSCRGIHSRGPFTEYIATRWYRPPETLLSSGKYNFKMDIWGAGCVLFEVYTRQPLFPGKDSLDQLHRIHEVLGTPSETLLNALMGSKMQSRYSFPEKKGTGLRALFSHVASDSCLSLLERLLEYDPNVRWSATQALTHPFFENTSLDLLPVDVVLFYKGAGPPKPPLESKGSDLQITVVPSVDLKQEGYLNRLNAKKQVEQSEQERADVKVKEKEVQDRDREREREKEKQVLAEVRQERKAKSKVVNAILRLKKMDGESKGSLEHLPSISKAPAAGAQAEHRRVKQVEITFALPKIGQMPVHNSNGLAPLPHNPAGAHAQLGGGGAGQPPGLASSIKDPAPGHIHTLGEHKPHWTQSQAPMAIAHHPPMPHPHAGGHDESGLHKAPHERSYAELLMIKRREIERERERERERVKDKPTHAP